eukprot:1112566-Amphidinium_carterae.1
MAPQWSSGTAWTVCKVSRWWKTFLASSRRARSPSTSCSSSRDESCVGALMCNLMERPPHF